MDTEATILTHGIITKLVFEIVIVVIVKSW
jgi:hypothetical protein